LQKDKLLQKMLKYQELLRIVCNKGEDGMSRVSAGYIVNASYFPVRKMLEVQFVNDDGIYQFFDVPEEEWYSMRNTLSMDLYFNMQISTRYKSKMVRKGEKEAGNHKLKKSL